MAPKFDTVKLNHDRVPSVSVGGANENLSPQPGEDGTLSEELTSIFLSMDRGHGEQFSQGRGDIRQEKPSRQLMVPGLRQY